MSDSSEDSNCTVNTLRRRHAAKRLFNKTSREDSSPQRDDDCKRCRHPRRTYRSSPEGERYNIEDDIRLAVHRRQRVPPKSARPQIEEFLEELVNDTNAFTDEPVSLLDMVYFEQCLLPKTATLKQSTLHQESPEKIEGTLSSGPDMLHTK
jgi:hypothetical protein